MPSKLDLKGQRFGKLVVVRESDSRNGRAYWVCKCDCGNEKTVATSKLRNGNTRSCRCLSRELAGDRVRTHGLSKTPEHDVWKGIRQRCNNPSDGKYRYYGGRGIKLCSRWNDFRLFIEDMGRRPSADHQIDRINVDGHYEPSNCRWADRSTQANNKRNNYRITYNGQTMTLHEWANLTGIPAATIRARVDVYKWPVEKALTLPLQFDASNKTGHVGIFAQRHGLKNYSVRFSREGRVFDLGRFYTLDQAVSAKEKAIKDYNIMMETICQRSA